MAVLDRYPAKRMAYSKGVLAVVGAKGGVGKTTTSLNLAAAMAAAGPSVVAVELDIGMANFVDFLDVDGDDAATIHDVLAGDSTIESARRRVADGFFIAPSGTQLTGYANTDLDRLPQVLDALAWYHDVIVVDTPAGVGEEIVRSLELADEAILVSTPRVASIRNAENTIELADRIGTGVRGLVLTKSGTGASPGADRIADFLDVPLLGHVPEDDAVPHSQDRGQAVVDYAPRSGAAIAYRTITEKLIEDPSVPDGSSADSGDAGRSDDGHADSDAGRSGDGDSNGDDVIGDATHQPPSTEPAEPVGEEAGAEIGRGTDRHAGAPAPSHRGDAPSANAVPTDDGPTRMPTVPADTDHPAAPDAGFDDDGETGETARAARPSGDGSSSNESRRRTEDEANSSDGPADGVTRNAVGQSDGAESAEKADVGPNARIDADDDSVQGAETGGRPGSEADGRPGSEDGSRSGDGSRPDHVGSDGGASHSVGGRIRNLLGL